MAAPRGDPAGHQRTRPPPARGHCSGGRSTGKRPRTATAARARRDLARRGAPGRTRRCPRRRPVRSRRPTSTPMKGVSMLPARLTTQAHACVARRFRPSPAASSGPSCSSWAYGRRGGQLVENRATRRHRQRVARQRARLVHVAGRGEPLHQRPSAAERADRQAATDDLAEAGDVGPDTGELLGATPGHAEAGHHLVEDEQHAVAGGERAQRLQVAGARQHAAHVAGDRLDDDRGDALPLAVEDGRRTAARSL